MSASRLAFLLLTLLQTSLNAQPVDLWRAGQDGVHTFRIPALAVTSDGTLVAVADARLENAGDLPSPIRLVARRSTDGGRTWEATTCVRQVPREAGSVGDAALVVDRASGKLGCLHAFGPPGVGFFTSTKGLQVHALWSADAGRTWSPPQDLTPQLADPAWDACFVTSGNHPQTSTGRLVITLVARTAKRITSHLAFSDDGGRTWQRGANAGPGDESRVVELSDGSLLQNIRTPWGFRFQLASKDGQMALGVSSPTVRDPGCNAGLVRRGTDLFLVHCADPKRRKKLTLRRSSDQGRTWRSGLVLVPGPAAYASLAALPDGHMAVLYEDGDRTPHERIRFLRVDPTTIP